MKREFWYEMIVNRIKTNISYNKDKKIIEIRETRCGMSKKDIRKLGKPLYTGKPKEDKP